jgi:hypothetical protein
MYYLKGSKHLYLIDYNDNAQMPVFASFEDIEYHAVRSENKQDIKEIQGFLKERHDMDTQIEWQSPTGLKIMM